MRLLVPILNEIEQGFRYKEERPLHSLKSAYALLTVRQVTTKYRQIHYTENLVSYTQATLFRGIWKMMKDAYLILSSILKVVFFVIAPNRSGRRWSR
jgi:hypothetical protein